MADCSEYLRIMVKVMVFNATNFSYIVTVSFICGGNRGKYFEEIPNLDI